MSQSNKRPAVLVICDGWGFRDDTSGNAIANANTPRLNQLFKKWPHTLVEASGEAVGLPAGQIGNSEVGHLTIGSGRIKFQPLSRQIHEVESGNFKDNKILADAIAEAKSRGKAVHIMGLLSPGGVHSHDGSAYALVEMARDHGVEDIFIHAFGDGRDVAPSSLLEYIQSVALPRLSQIGAGAIASISGRYYAMDRDNRWERTEAVYDMLTADEFDQRDSIEDYIRESYSSGVTDEFIKPMRIAVDDRSVRVEDGDLLIFFNFRPDRARQLSHAVFDKDFDGFTRKRTIRDLQMITLANYDALLQVPVAFPDETLPNSLGEMVSRQGLRQIHIAETEKYAHVTYFLNGGIELPFEGEDRQMVPSPKVATYDLQPEMSAKLVTESTVGAIRSNVYDLVVVNYANADMVGHTGVYDASVTAIETLDDCVSDVIEATLSLGGVAIFTSDHGNAEQMIDDNGEPITAHTTNLVPLLMCGLEGVGLQENGGLRDIAPTILDIMAIDKPEEMTGSSLLKSNSV